jgi:hypothetical protein
MIELTVSAAWTRGTPAPPIIAAFWNDADATRAQMQTWSAALDALPWQRTPGGADGRWLQYHLFSLPLAGGTPTLTSASPTPPYPFIQGSDWGFSCYGNVAGTISSGFTARFLKSHFWLPRGEAVCETRGLNYDPADHAQSSAAGFSWPRGPDDSQPRETLALYDVTAPLETARLDPPHNLGVFQSFQRRNSVRLWAPFPYAAQFPTCCQP